MSLNRERPGRLATFEELLKAQRESGRGCPHCGGNCEDRARDQEMALEAMRTQEMALEAMRTRIRVLEAAWAHDIERGLVAKA